jgi:hypothetical protein
MAHRAPMAPFWHLHSTFYSTLYLYRKRQGTHDEVAADLSLMVIHYFPIINFSTKFKLRASAILEY